jgi:hypothetical protein
MPAETERFGYGEWPSVEALPEHMRALHRKQMAAVRAERQARLEAASEDERRWPGLVTPKSSRKTNR